MVAENLLFDNAPIKANKIPIQPDIEDEENFLFSSDAQEISEEQTLENTEVVEEVQEVEPIEQVETKNIDAKEDEVFYFSGDGEEEKITTLDKLEYGFDKNDNVVGNLWRTGENALEALFDPDRNFEEVSLQNEADKVRKFEEEHWKMLDGKSDGAYTLIGEGASFLTDPYYLAGYFYGRGLMATPLTSAYLNAALIGGDNFIEQLSKTGKVDLKQVGKSAAIGGAIGFVLPFGGKLVSKYLPNHMKSKVEQVTMFMDKRIAKANGVTQPELLAIRAAANKEPVKKITNKLDDLIATDSWKTSGSNFTGIISRTESNFLNLKKQLTKEAFDINKARQKLKKVKWSSEEAKNTALKLRSKKILDIREKVKVAKDAWLKQDAALKVRASAKLDKYMRLETERTTAILNELSKTQNIGHKFLKAVLANFTRPLVGGAGGAAANVGAGALGMESAEDDMAQWIAAGAFLGLSQKAIQKSIKMPVAYKDAAGKIIENHAVRFTFQKLREITAGSAATKLNSFGGPTQKISRLLFRQVDDPLAEKSVIAQAESMDRYFLRRAHNIIKNSTPEMQIEANSIIRGNTELAKRASKDVLKLADDLKGWMDEFKTLYNKAGFFSPKDLDNYFPRVLDWGKINADRPYAEKVFTEIFKKNYNLTTDKAKAAAKNYLTKSEGPGVSSVINQRAWNKIISGSEKGVARSRNKLTGEYDLINTPISDHITKNRSLQGKFSIVEGVLEREGFLINDLNLILPKIIRDSTKSIAFARTFGKGGALLKPLIEQIKTKYDDLALKNNKIGLGATRTGAAEHEANLVLDSIDAYFDRFGLGKGREWSSSIGVLTMLSNLNMLGRVTISSLGDIIQPFQNSRSWTAAVKGLARTNLFKATWEKGLARSLGYDFTNEMSRSVAKTAAVDSRDLMLSQAWMGKWGVKEIPKRVGENIKSPGFYNNLAFKGLGLEWLTGYARRFAYNTGSADAYNLARQLYKINKAGNGTKRGARQLEKDLYETYGIRKNQALLIGQGKSFNIAIKNKNAKRFLNEAGLIGSNRDALIPQVSNRLLFTQSKDPRIRMLGQFLSWAQAKSAQTNRILQRIESGDARTLIKTLAAIPVYAGIQQLREYAKHGDVITDAEYNTGELFAKAYQLSGMPGWISDLAFNRFVGPGSTNSPLYVFAPALNMATNIGDWSRNLLKGKPDDAWKIMDKKILPVPNWREWVRKFWFPRGVSIGKSSGNIKAGFKYGGVVRKKYNEGDVVYGNNAEINEIKKDLISTPHVEEKSNLLKKDISEIEAYVPLIKKEEGHGDEIKDSKGNVIAYKNYRLGDEKHITSGYGFYDKSNKENDSVTVEQAEKDLRKNIKIKLAGAKKGIKNFNNLSDNLKKQIVSSWYRGSLSGSPLTRELINAGKFEKAAEEFLNNAEYRAAVESGSGVAKRMEAVAAALRNEANNKDRQKFGGGDVVADLKSKPGIKLIRDFIAEGFSVKEAIDRAKIEIETGNYNVDLQ